MQTDLLDREEPQAYTLRRMASTLESLNVRIARLAIGLGISLDSDDDLVRAMSAGAVSSVAHERRCAPERRDCAGTGRGADRRLSHQRVELRGLLVLRYGVETRCVQQVGVDTARQMLIEIESDLERGGFKPGVDGMSFDRLPKTLENF